MPIKKNPETRYHEIIRLLNLKNSGFVRKIELVRRCGIKERTLKADIAFLRSAFGAKIRYDRKGEGYCLDEPFEMPILPLNLQDFSRLKVAVRTLSQLKHLDIFKDLEATLDKIANAVKLRTASAEITNRIFFEPVPFYQGTELIQTFLNAMYMGQSIRFQYLSFKSQEVHTHEIHPYFIQEFSHRWYIVGWSPEYQSIMPFALDRVQNTPNITDSVCDIPNFDRDDYFKNTYGMTRYSEDNIEDVILSFSPLQAKYFKSKPFHAYQTVDETDECLVVKMRLVVNYELKRKIVGMGADVKVIQPTSLVESIKKIHQKALALYK